MSEQCRAGDEAGDRSEGGTDAGMPDAERRRRIRAAFDEAVVASPERRARRLADLAETDPDIAAEVATLLEAVEGPDGSAAGLEPPRDRSDPMLGRVLGPPETGWRLESLIGAGGSGRVYRAVRVHDGAIAAVKVLSPARASQAGLARLKSEIAATRRIDHPGVVPVIEAVGDGVTAGDAAAVADAAADPDAASGEKAWIAFELVTGARWITEHALDLPEADVGAVLELVLAVADAVAAAHAAGVVHRDLKPSNLLVGADGRPRVIDFGIARLLDPLGEGSTILAERTREGEILGTPAYMAPEQVDPRLGRVSPRTDVHALGVLAFRLLSGRMPYETGGNLLAAAQAIRHVPPRSLRALAPEVPAAVEAVLMAAMSKEPEGRPADAGDFARRLRAAMDPGSASAPATAAATPRRTRGVTAVAIVLPVMFMLAWLAGRGGTPEAAGPTATTPATGGHPLRVAFEQPSRPVASGGRTLRVPSQHPTIQAAIDAAVDGDLVLIAPGTYRETLQIGGRSIEVRGEGRAAEVILESPDGGRILSLEGTRTSVAAFRDLSFTGSRSHEAVQVGKAGAIFERCLFRDNASAGLTADPGPETRCDAESVLQFLDCLFLENGSNMGAGVRLIRRSAVFDGCGFIDNLAANRPQDTGRAAGAGLYYSSWYCGGFTLEIRDGVFAGNRAEWGGAIYAEGDLRPADEQSAVRIERTVFFSNDAIEGRIAWPFMVRFSVRDSLLCGDGDLIHDQWIDGGDNRVLAGRGEAPYEDADGDLVPDRLQELLGLSTRARDRIMFEEASHPAADGRTLRVPGDHETVQAAIDAAADGDLVLIAPGIYRESLETRGKAIELRGEGRAAEVILESPSGGRVLLVSDAAGARPAFRDLTFTGSDRDFAVWVFDGAAVFERCVFRDNPGGGVGDFDSDCDPNPASSYLDCLFLDNAGTEGGGLRVQRRSILVDGCGFVGNRADQPAIAPGRGAGGGLYYSDFECGRTGSRIRDCVFAGNKAQWGGGMYVEGDFVPEGSEPTVTVDRSVFHANIAEEGEAAWTWSVRLELSRSEVCGPGDLFHNEWINAGRNVIRPACLDDPPYDDEDGDLIPDRLQRLLGVPTRPRDRSSFERPSMPAEDGRILRVPGNADSVQAAIDAASDGDLVLLAPGEHLESLDLRGKAIEIRGDGRANDVVLRSPDGGPVLTLASGETPATVFRDLTITGGVGGPAVRLRGAAASFERCIFRDNRGGAVHHAAASGTSEASPAESRYVDCLFLANSADEGGALRIDGRSVRIDGCSFVANRALGVTGGGAIRFLAMGEGVGGAASLVLRRCGFEANAATRGAAVHAVGSVSGDASHPRLHIDWCFFYPNAVGDGDAVWRSQAGEPVRSIRPEEVPREPGEAVDAVGVDVVMRRSFVCGSPDVVRADRIEAHGNRFDPICDRRGHGNDKDADRIPDVLEQLLGKEIPQLPDP